MSLLICIYYSFDVWHCVKGFASFAEVAPFLHSVVSIPLAILEQTCSVSFFAFLFLFPLFRRPPAPAQIVHTWRPIPTVWDNVVWFASSFLATLCLHSFPRIGATFWSKLCDRSRPASLIFPCSNTIAALSPSSISSWFLRNVLLGPLVERRCHPI